MFLAGLQFIHVSQQGETPQVKNIFLDVGAKDKKEVEKMVFTLDVWLRIQTNSSNSIKSGT